MRAHFGLQSLATEASPRALGRDNGATEELLGQLVQAIHFVYPIKRKNSAKRLTQKHRLTERATSEGVTANCRAYIRESNGVLLPGRASCGSNMWRLILLRAGESRRAVQEGMGMIRAGMAVVAWRV